MGRRPKPKDPTSPRPTLTDDLEADLTADVDFSKDDYDIARYAWEEGLAPTTILARMKWDKTPQNFTRVRRSLQKAVRYGLLQFRPPAATTLRRQVRERHPWLQELHVERDHTAACLRAARLIAADIERFWRTDDGRTRMVIANAGGTTLRDVVDALQRVAAPLPERDERKPEKNLVFLSLNAAEAPHGFDDCANFLAVRMGQIYPSSHTHHFAVVKSWTEATRKDYQATLQSIDLLISSAGSRHGFLSDLLELNQQPNPVEFVGDLAFHLIDAKGRPASVHPDINRSIEERLSRQPDWNDLVRIFGQSRTLLILTRARKVDIGRALFRSGLPKRCVLDVDVASHLAEPDVPA